MMKLISSEKKFESKIFTVTEDHAVDPGGFEIKRAIVHHAGSAVILAIDDQQRVLLVKQYRLPAQQDMWELPAGRIDAGESPLEAAKRELGEETGVSATAWKELVSYYASPGFLAERMTIFAAHGLTLGEAHWMDDERIEIAWRTGEQIDELIQTGELIDGKTLIGYLMWKRSGAGN